MTYTNNSSALHTGDTIFDGVTRRTRYRQTLGDLGATPEKPKPFNVEAEWEKVKDVWNNDKKAWARYAGVKLDEGEVRGSVQ